MSIICPRCSSENPDQARFCANCGNRLQVNDQVGSASQNASILTLAESLPSPVTMSPEMPSTPMTAGSRPTPFTPGLSSGTNVGRLQRLVPGTHLSEGRYRIEKLVAAGGMGAVYRAVDMRFDGPCAIKEMLDDFQNHGERIQAAEWFKREAKLLLILHHPSIPRVRDFFMEDDRHYLVMDFIEGRTLSDVLRKEGNVPGLNGAHGVSEVRARSWAQQICSVLSYLHRQDPPIIFRDLKPSNIMVTDRDEIKLIDFGIARTFHLRGHATIIMTIGYAPPEQLQGISEPRSDIYALGATLHRILTYHDAANNKPSIFSFPPVRSLRPDILPAFEQVIMKALAPNVDKRWSSAAEMERAIINLPPTTVQPSVQGTPQTSQQYPAERMPGTAYGSVQGAYPPMTPPVQQGSSTPQPNTPAFTPQPNTPPSYSDPYAGSSLYYGPPPRSHTSSGSQGSYPPSTTPPSMPHSSILSDIYGKPDSFLKKTFNGLRRMTSRKTKESHLSLFAIARANLEVSDRAYVGQIYFIQAGVAGSKPANFRAEPFDVAVPDPSAPLTFDILIHASDNIELQDEWHKRIEFSLATQLVRFMFKLVAAGHSFIFIDFYHNQRWLKTVRLEFEAVEQSRLSTVSSRV